MFSKYLYKGRKQYFKILQTKQVTEIKKQCSIYSDSSYLSKTKISMNKRECRYFGHNLWYPYGFNLVIFKGGWWSKLPL